MPWTPYLALLAEIEDPRRAEGKLYRLPHVVLFAILAMVGRGQLLPGQSIASSMSISPGCAAFSRGLGGGCRPNLSRLVIAVMVRSERHDHTQEWVVHR
jgi:hypothetical protein